MKFALVICTYKRSGPIIQLLESVRVQSKYPDAIIIVDGSPDNETGRAVENKNYPALEYHKVKEGQKGLTKQRNLGISFAILKQEIEIICFLDDDIVLTPTYFESLIQTYSTHPDAAGVGGYILDETTWKVKEEGMNNNDYEFDGWVRKLGSRNLLRKKLGLLSSKPPGYMPNFSHGLSISFLPPTDKIYPVQFFMGGVSSWRAEVLKRINFSEYFEGYGLYEDLEFCIRASNLGPLYVNTAAKLYHFHDDSGRPNKFQYGKMVIINGWYVWRKKFPHPPLKAIFKWHSISFLLTLIRLGNILSSHARKEAATEVAGRIYGWWKLVINSGRYK